jgi:hypothetical protein
MGERNFSGGSLQQFDAEPGFKRIQAASDDGWCNALGSGGSRQAAASRDIDKGRDLLELIHEMR